MNSQPTHETKSVLRRRRLQRKHRYQRLVGLPSAVILLNLLSSAGQSPRTAISWVSRLSELDGPIGVIARDLAVVSGQLERGASLDGAVFGASARHGASDDLVRVLDLLRRAEIDGGSLTAQFDFLINDLRRQRANALDESAQRLTVWMLFPLVLCILPAFVLLVVAPLLVDALAGLPQ